MKLQEAARTLVDTHPLAKLPPEALYSALVEEADERFSLSEFVSDGRIEGSSERTELMRQLNLFAAAFGMIGSHLDQLYTLDDRALDPFRDLGLEQLPYGVRSRVISPGKVWIDGELKDVDVNAFDHPLAVQRLFQMTRAGHICQTSFRAYLDPAAERLMALKMSLFPGGCFPVTPDELMDESKPWSGRPYHTMFAPTEVYLHRGGINYSDRSRSDLSASLHFSPDEELERGSLLEVDIDVSADRNVLSGSRSFQRSGRVFTQKSFAELFPDLLVDQA